LAVDCWCHLVEAAHGVGRPPNSCRSITTPVHFGAAEKIRADRAQVLAAAYARNPERFNWRPEPPKLPTMAAINSPSDSTRLQTN
jgi:hypothetical protein